MMTEQEQTLWEAYQQDRTDDNRNALVENFMPLATDRANHMRKYGRYDERLSAAYLALIYAVEGYNNAIGVDFESYATLCIRNAIIDSMRERDHLTVGYRRKEVQIRRDKEHLSKEFGRPPTVIELAEYRGISEEEMFEEMIFDLDHFKSVEDICKTYEDLCNNEETFSGPFESELTVFDKLEINSNKEIIELIMKRLPVTQQKIIKLFHYDNVNCKEIGKELGINKSTVRRMLVDARHEFGKLYLDILDLNEEDQENEFE